MENNKIISLKYFDDALVKRVVEFSELSIDNKTIMV